MHGRLWAAAVAALSLGALGACSQGGAPPGQANATAEAPANNVAAPAANGAATPNAPAANSAAATNSAAAATPLTGPPPPFVAQLLGTLNSSHPDRYQEDASFKKLVEENGALAGKEGDADLDYDPVCQCQDSGAHYSYVSGAANADGSFSARLKTADGETPPWSVVLKPEAGGAWGVWDVIDQNGSIRAYLTRHNDCMRRIHGDDNALVKCFGEPG